MIIRENVNEVEGYDGIDMAYFYSPSITTIRQPIEEMARETVEVLFDVIQNAEEHQHKTFEGELIIGNSTREI